jgi:hypothetical protein
MAKTIKPDQLSAVLSQELTIYGEDVQEKVDNAGRRAMEKLVSITRDTAPKGSRKSRKFYQSIASKEDEGPRGHKFIWYVKAPNHRLTHLLVHGHAKVNGGRVAGNPFLHNALKQVLPEYEQEVEEAVKNDR